jgi:hypothetical protein
MTSVWCKVWMESAMSWLAYAAVRSRNILFLSWNQFTKMFRLWKIVLFIPQQTQANETALNLRFLHCDTGQCQTNHSRAIRLHVSWLVISMKPAEIIIGFLGTWHFPAVRGTIGRYIEATIVQSRVTKSSHDTLSILHYKWNYIEHPIAAFTRQKSKQKSEDVNKNNNNNKRYP